MLMVGGHWIFEQANGTKDARVAHINSGPGNLAPHSPR